MTISQFKAIRVHDTENGKQASIETMSLNDLCAGDVTIRSAFSSINYKDALAITGQPGIMRKYPLNAGIDVAGVVESSSSTEYKAGDKVIVTGSEMSQLHDGGLSEIVRVPAEWIVPLPDGLSLYESMLLGTAGFTAGLALLRLEQNGLTPDQGEVLISGASGGVGSIAIQLFSRRGYKVVAMSATENVDYLIQLGAQRVISPPGIKERPAALEHARWAGALDTIGGDVLSGITRQLKPWGSVASIGLAGGANLSMTTMPFIIRGVSVLGITSADCPYEIRKRVWTNLADKWKPQHMDSIANKEITLEEAFTVAKQILKRQHHGRTVVKFDSQP
jgi:NADPH2:quinone reductase